MSKRAFDKIAEGLEEALAIARGEAVPARSHMPPEIAVPRVAYASEEGWAAIHRMLDEDHEPRADVVARLKRGR
jgi:hypothetical protein